VKIFEQFALFDPKAIGVAGRVPTVHGVGRRIADVQGDLEGKARRL